MLLKLISLSLIIMSCGYIGLAKQHCYKNRVTQLLLCEKLLINIKILIKSSNATTKTIFSLLAKNTCFDEFIFIKNTNKLLQENSDFPDIFNKELDKAYVNLDLKYEDLLPLYSLCNLIGSCDTEEVLQGLEYAIVSIKSLTEEAKTSLETSGYLSGKIGFWVGVFICILIV